MSQPELTKLLFQRNFEFFGSDGPVELHVALNVEVPQPEDYDPEGTLVFLNVVIGGTEDDPFSLDAEMCAEFSWEEDEIPEDIIPLFLRRNAPALLLGYLRPIVATTIQMSGLPPYNIPFMDFTGE